MPENKFVLVGNYSSGGGNIPTALRVDSLGRLSIDPYSLADGVSFKKIDGVSVQALAIADDDPSLVDGYGAVIAAFNPVNSSYRLVRQDNLNRLSVATPISKDGLLKSVATSATINGAYNEAINNISTGAINYVNIISVTCTPVLANFTVVIMYSDGGYTL